MVKQVQILGGVTPELRTSHTEATNLDERPVAHISNVKYSKWEAVK